MIIRLTLDLGFVLDVIQHAGPGPHRSPKKKVMHDKLKDLQLERRTVSPTTSQHRVWPEDILCNSHLGHHLYCLSHFQRQIVLSLLLQALRRVIQLQAVKRHSLKSLL